MKTDPMHITRSSPLYHQSLLLQSMKTINAIRKMFRLNVEQVK